MELLVVVPLIICYDGGRVECRSHLVEFVRNLRGPICHLNSVLLKASQFVAQIGREWLAPAKRGHHLTVEMWQIAAKSP
ncbi:MAG TPA: hypothetical protein VMB21_04005 [Candidatus Limnocylindria bacterium]|nr:hypothetical protein [Candidatus Limnocylindria bacterium]